MQVSNPNNVNIYNLSVGKSLPEWLSDRKKRQLQKTDSALRRRIELIQDFSMPAVSNTVQVSKDGQYIIATGVYKPRVKCYDVSQLSMKFERCFDSEVIKTLILSDDYSKLLFLQVDRYVELHAQYGRYYRLRIPMFGHDLSYHHPSCDLYFVGASSEIVRLNLEQGKFLNSLVTDAVGLNVCDINPVHQLFGAGTVDGRVECWDPRTRGRIRVLDCALNSLTEHTEVDGLPGITALKFKDGLTMAVGTSTGQVLMYDIRAGKPLHVKDHQYGLPIKTIDFHDPLNLVITSDAKIVKLWDRNTGKAFTSIEPSSEINDLCLVPDSGLMFMANEAPRLLTYFIPALGPAPKWCSFLDNMTEELEESDMPTVYEDYKFVTRTDIENLGLSHLLGTSLLRAYMHGFFMDIRLYHRAQSLAQPFAFEDFKKKKIREKIEASRENRVKTAADKLPAVNRSLAKVLSEREGMATDKRQKRTLATSLLADQRFAAMFRNPDFEVDAASEDYQRLNPVLATLEKQKAAKSQERLAGQFDRVAGEEEEESEAEGQASDEEHSSSDEDDYRQMLREEVYKQRRQLSSQQFQEREEQRRQRRRQQQQQVPPEKALGEAAKRPHFYEIKAGEQFAGIGGSRSRRDRSLKASFGDRLHSLQKDNDIIGSGGSARGSKQMTFSANKTEEKRQKEAEKEHREERKKLRRSAAGFMRKPNTSQWKRK